MIFIKSAPRFYKTTTTTTTTTATTPCVQVKQCARSEDGSETAAGINVVVWTLLGVTWSPGAARALLAVCRAGSDPVVSMVRLVLLLFLLLFFNRFYSLYLVHSYNQDKGHVLRMPFTNTHTRTHARTYTNTHIHEHPHARTHARLLI